MTTTGLGGWLWLGWLTGAGCLVGCGPVLAPYLISRGPVERRVAWRPLAEFLAGRLSAYLLVGLPSVLLGERLQGWWALRPALGVVTLALAVALLAQGLGHDLVAVKACGGWCGQVGRRVPFAAGFALGLAPCAPLLLAVSTLLTAGGPAHGLAFLAAFGVSTTIWLLPLLGLGALGRRESWRGVSQVALVFAGLWFLARGGVLLLGR